MEFDDFDKRMRVYEQSIDQYIVPGMYIAARGWTDAVLLN